MGKFTNGIYRFFSERRGTDQLGIALIVVSLVVSLLASIFVWPIVSYITLIVWVWALYRMLSKNIAAREKENKWFLSKFTPIASYVRQARARFKNRKIYLYYHCPQCKAWLKLPRNVGEKTVTCGKCGATFKQKA